MAMTAGDAWKCLMDVEWVVASWKKEEEVNRLFVSEGERMRGTDHVLVGQWILGEVGLGLPPQLASARGVGRIEAV